MNIPSVSVIMPIYNSADYVEQAIRSILDQTLEDFELILIDDGSTDETSEIIKKFHDPRIVMIHHDRNEGIVSSLNDGLRLARGEFIARMDADDISLPDRLSKQRAYLLLHPEYGVCGTSLQLIGTQQILHMPVDPEELKCQLLYHTCLFHPTVMVRRRVLEQHNIWYDSSYPYAQDYALWVKLSHVTKLSNLQEVLLYYRTHNQQITFVHGKHQLEMANRIRREQLVKLGVIPNAEEWDIHVNLASRNSHFVPPGAKATWVQKILNANMEKNLYDQVALVKLLSDD
jgi:glycosyltransferase involved in cell wall biosynthesis